MTRPGPLSDSRLDVLSRPIWADLVELRLACQAGELGADDVVNTASLGAVAVRVVPSLPVLDLARMARPELVRLTESGARPAFGLRLDAFGDPTRMSSSSERAKPLLTNIAVNYGWNPPCAYIRAAHPLVLAEPPPAVHCHFTGGETTPVQALELLRRASVNESAGMVSVYPRELANPQFGLMLDLTGLRLQFPNQAAISVSGDGALVAALAAVVPVVNKRCREAGLPGISRTELPPAMLDSKPPHGAARPGPKHPSDPGDPLAPPPGYVGPRDQGGRPRRHP